MSFQSCGNALLKSRGQKSVINTLQITYKKKKHFLCYCFSSILNSSVAALALPQGWLFFYAAISNTLPAFFLLLVYFSSLGLFLFSWLVFSSLGYSLISSDGPHIEPLQPFTLLFFLLLACCFGKRARQKKRPISMNFCHIGPRGVVWPIMDFWCIFYGDYVEILWIFCVDFVFFLCFLLFRDCAF